MDREAESDAALLWEAVVSAMEGAGLAGNIVAMLDSCEALSLDDGELHVGASSRFIQRSVGRLQAELSKAASEAAFADVTVVVDTTGAPRRAAGTSGPARTVAPRPETPRRTEPVREASAAPKPARRANPLVEEVTSIDSLLTFDRFVEGPQNKFALDAAKQVANGNRNYNPLFIYGKSGLGKTHLLRAIQNYLAQNDPERTCVYRIATDFIDDFTQAMRPNSKESVKAALHENYRSVDVLIIDDIQLMSTASRTIGFFFDTFNYLVGHGKQIVLAADRTPSELGMGQSEFDERVTSRLDSGMTVSIQVPDYELKLHLIDAFYERMRDDARLGHVRGLDAEIGAELRRYMAERAGTNIRVIEGFVQSCLMLAFQRESQGGRISEEDISRVADQKFPSGRARVKVEQIQEAVEEIYGVDHADLIGSKRTKELTEPRHVAIWLTRELTDNTLAEIGAKFGGRTHATVKHSISIIERTSTEDRILRDRIARIRDAIEEKQ